MNRGDSRAGGAIEGLDEAVEGGRMREIIVGSTTLRVHEATSPTQWATGLAGKDLSDVDGMLFLMSRDNHSSFHMDGVHQPLVLALFDDDGALVDVAYLPPQVGFHRPRARFRYAVELACPCRATSSDLLAGLRLP